MKVKVTEGAKHLKNLTVGKEYNVLIDKGHKVMVVDNNNENYNLHPAKLFERLEEEKVEPEKKITEERMDDGVCEESGDIADEPRNGEGDEVPVSLGSERMDETGEIAVKKSRKAKRKYNKKVDEEDEE